MKIRSLKYVGYSAALACGLVGACGPTGPPMYPVSGTVRVDGHSLSDGYIILIDKAAVHGSHACRVADGAFSLQSTAGTKIVSFRATRFTGKYGRPDPTEPPVPLMEQYIAPQYSEKSRLEVEVIQGGDNHFEFDVKSLEAAGSK